MKIIGVIGSRTRNTDADLTLLLKKFKDVYQEGDWLCSGGCYSGGDKFAEDIAKKTGIPILMFYAAWWLEGNGAGFARNPDIAKHSNVLISLQNLTRDGGAEDTVRHFIKFNGGSEEDLHII